MNLICGHCGGELEAMEVNKTYVRVLCMTCARRLNAFDAMATKLAAVLPDKVTAPKADPDAPAVAADIA